jgi:hypothetical protein
VNTVGDFTRFQEPVWDRFFDLVSEGDEDLSRVEVQEELKRRGVDVTRAVNKVQQALQTSKAKLELEMARKIRPGLTAKARRLALPDIGARLEDLKRQVLEQFRGEVQMAFFRKLEGAESEEDLRTLLEDAKLLDALSEEPDDAGGQAE